jgi:hypothetical protein
MSTAPNEVPMRALPLLALLTLGCNPFENPRTDGWTSFEDELWDPEVVAASDGIYVRLPHAGRLVRVSDDGSFLEVDLDGARPTRLVAAPDHGSVLAFATWQTCEDPDPKIETAADCDEDDLGEEAELDVLIGGALDATADVPGHMNTLEFSDDGSTAVAFLDYDLVEGSVQVEGVWDPNEVVFIRLSDGSTQGVSVGFSPNNVLFSEDSSKAVVLSRSKVVVVDLATFEVEVSYPLTLDDDEEIDPAGATITPDGRYAMIGIQGSSDLYVLDLENESIDIQSLDAAPNDIAVQADADIESGVTVLVYGNKAQVDLMENEYFEITSIELDDPMTRILEGEGFALLFNDRSTGTVRDVYKLDLESRAVTEYVMGNPVHSMQLTESGQYAVGVLRPETQTSGGVDSEQDARWGLGVIDLSTDKEVSLVTESAPVGLALVESEGTTFALLLLEGVDYLLQLDLQNLSAFSTIDLPAPPVSIGDLPDGRFYITHESRFGLISFLDPATGDLLPASGFATAGLLVDDTLPRRGEE